MDFIIVIFHSTITVFSWYIIINSIGMVLKRSVINFFEEIRGVKAIKSVLFLNPQLSVLIKLLWPKGSLGNVYFAFWVETRRAKL